MSDRDGELKANPASARVLLVVVGFAAGCGPSVQFAKQPNATVSGNPEPLQCRAERKDGAIVVGASRAAARRGYNDYYFSDRESTVDEPIEVCGFEEQLLWLTAMHCNDGTRPWGDNLKAAHDGRRGAVMSMDPGNCNRMIDVYPVKCPEAKYTVYINLYVCPSNKSVHYNWDPKQL